MLRFLHLTLCLSPLSLSLSTSFFKLFFYLSLSLFISFFLLPLCALLSYPSCDIIHFYLSLNLPPLSLFSPSFPLSPSPQRRRPPRTVVVSPRQRALGQECYHAVTHRAGAMPRSSHIFGLVYMIAMFIVIYCKEELFFVLSFLQSGSSLALFMRKRWTHFSRRPAVQQSLEMTLTAYHYH